MAPPDEYVIDFKTLFVAAAWVEHHCVIPDGFQKGRPFELVDWQLWALLNFYRLKPSARVGQLAPAFHFRRAQIILPQKAGKAPYTAAHICLEGVGPALFAGWATGGERWDCRDHGCGCGWVYEYERGEAMGQAWPTPLIQITAHSEKQTDNIYGALRPMIDDGPLTVLIPKTGEEFIRLPNKGRIDVVTSSAKSRLGARVTFVPQDETGIWTSADGMINVSDVQRRGLAGMGGRAEETSNAWDPNGGSVAQLTGEAAERTGDIFRIHPLPPQSWSYKNKEERRKIHRLVYTGCPWVDLDAIEAEAAELIGRDVGQAERFFGNRPTAGAGFAFDGDRWDELAKPTKLAKHSVVVLGVDGALHDDAIAVIATDVKTGYQWVVDIVERPLDAGEEYKHDQARVDAAVTDVFDRFLVWRAYCDPQYIGELVSAWQNRWGEKRVIEWMTYRARPIGWAVRNFTQAIADGDVSHDGNPVFSRHIRNAHKRLLTALDDDERQMWTLSKDATGSARKIDAAMAAVVSWEARSDCIAAGGVMMDEVPVVEVPEPVKWDPRRLPALAGWSPQQPVGPLGPLS